MRKIKTFRFDTNDDLDSFNEMFVEKTGEPATQVRLGRYDPYIHLRLEFDMDNAVDVDLMMNLCLAFPDDLSEIKNNFYWNDDAGNIKLLGNEELA